MNAKRVSLIMEVAGCPTVCMHCWAQGMGYKMMPFEDIAWSLEGISNFFDKVDLEFSSYPMHEVLAHPDAAEILSIFKPFATDQFEPLATTGVPLVIRDDWKDLLKQIESLGTTTTFVTHFHGVGETHDKIMNRAGAYEETCLAVKRICSMGFRCIFTPMLHPCAGVGWTLRLRSTARIQALNMYRSKVEILEYLINKWVKEPVTDIEQMLRRDFPLFSDSVKVRIPNM